MSSSPEIVRHPAPAWPGRAVAAWGVLFALPSFYWALGGLSGASTAVAPALVELARERDPGFVAVLWVTGVLKLVGAALGLALIHLRGGGRRRDRVLQFLAWGAVFLLAWHGMEFVVHGVLVEADVISVDPDLRTVRRWYTYLWGPWFLAGGLGFALAARAHLSTVTDRRDARRAGRVGALCALVPSAGLTVLAMV
ncbi:DUF3995 domain-containing protein [Embleya sp. NPDC020630]|uniref:DUF3995 domain-containing protein n=1 Tax=Embleya sp. NPDC020630 TaxID=3363979 RepID=UPI0037AF9F53